MSTTARGSLMPPPRRILFIRLWGLGDVLLTTPAVHAVRQAYPGAHIEYLTTRSGADALQNNPDVDRVHVVSKGTAPMLRALWQVRHSDFDVVADFHSTPRTSYFAAASNARMRIGFEARGPRAALYTHAVPRSHTTEYLASVLFRIVGPLGIDTGNPDLTLRIAITDEERSFADRIWREHELSNAPVVALSAVSLQSYKRWAPARWARVADSMIDAGAKVIMTHGPGEEAQVAAVTSMMRHTAVHALDIRSVRQLAAIYQRADVWVGNDGGAKHVAVAAGTPTVTVSRYTFGLPWTDPRADQRHVFIEQPPPQGCDLRCSSCPHIGCLDAISAEEVASLVVAELNQR